MCAQTQTTDACPHAAFVVARLDLDGASAELLSPAHVDGGLFIAGGGDQMLDANVDVA